MPARAHPPAWRLARLRTGRCTAKNRSWIYEVTQFQSQPGVALDSTSSPANALATLVGVMRPQVACSSSHRSPGASAGLWHRRRGSPIVDVARAAIDGGCDQRAVRGHMSDNGPQMLGRGTREFRCAPLPSRRASERRHPDGRKHGPGSATSKADGPTSRAMTRTRCERSIARGDSVHAVHALGYATEHQGRGDTILAKARGTGSNRALAHPQWRYHCDSDPSSA